MNMTCPNALPDDATPQ